MKTTLKKKVIIGILLFSIIVLSGYTLSYAKKNYRRELLGNVVVQRTIPLYRSLRKLPDIVFMPWSAFAKSNLDTYELSISPRDIERMNAKLPDSPFLTTLEDEGKLWVSGYFRSKDYEGSVKVRYRGNQPSHWNAYQKSYSIKFPKNNLFEGKEKITLVIPSDRRYIDMSLNDYRAEKLGLIHPSEQFVNLEVNGAKTGVLLRFESWSQPWIEKMPISALSTIYGVDEGDAPYRERWSSWNAIEPIDFDPLDTLAEIVDHASDEEFEKLIPLVIDIEDWYAWDVMRILAAGYHGDSDNSFGGNNLVLIFDRGEGRFKPVPYNIINYTPSHRALTGNPTFTGPPDHLLQRILNIPAFRAHRDEVFANYVENEKEDDLVFLENWKKKYNREFLLDNAKNDNHFTYLSKIKESIEAVTNHFDDPFSMLEASYTPPVDIKEELSLPDSFKYLTVAGTTPDIAAKQHPNLLIKNNELTIPTGIHTFLKTIIIPKGTHLSISPGAILRMGEGVSLISYSPVTALGTEKNPIRIEGTTKETDWGVFAIINTNESTSSLSYVYADHGGEATINGAYISGTIAFHNSNGTISNSRVSHAQGDDGINIKGARVDITNTLLEKNSSDGVDLDFVNPEMIFRKNTFIQNQGDSIDISWSNLAIEDNTVIGCVDKGVSVGEKSRPTITNNLIVGCAIGIAIKDSSSAQISNNRLLSNETTFSLYQKKPYFEGGTATATENVVFDTNVFKYLDKLSVLNLKENSTSTKPTLSDYESTITKEYLGLSFD